MRRRIHYSTALSQAQSIIPESFSLFELWENGVSSTELVSKAQDTNILNIDTERRLKNIVLEGFFSRYLRDPHKEAAPYLKLLFQDTANYELSKQLMLLYAIRQHGIFLDFLSEEYWPCIRAGGSEVRNSDVLALIDRGSLSGKITKAWSESVRKRVSSYVLGIAADFGFLSPSRSGNRHVSHWAPEINLITYLAYDLHFLGYSDNEVVTADEWKALGLQREDITIYFNRLQSLNHLTVQDTGHLCRIDWNYKSREELNYVLTN